MIDIIFPKSAEKYANLQCNSQISDYKNCPELGQISNFLANLHPIRVLELGAGLGRGSVWLRNTFNWNSTQFYLLDGNSGEEQIAGINSAIGNNFYNSLSATEEFCLANGIDKEKLFLINAEETLSFDNIKFDLCFSIKSIGFHWPIASYLNLLERSFAPNCYCFFELRSVKNCVESRKKRMAKFVESQLKSIDLTVFTIVQFDPNLTFPILVLKKCKESING